MVGVTWLGNWRHGCFSEIIWVDLTTVPSSRLVLLALLASLVWLGDLWTGLFLSARHGDKAADLLHLGCVDPHVNDSDRGYFPAGCLSADG